MDLKDSEGRVVLRHINILSVLIQGGNMCCLITMINFLALSKNIALIYYSGSLVRDGRVKSRVLAKIYSAYVTSTYGNDHETKRRTKSATPTVGHSSP